MNFIHPARPRIKSLSEVMVKFKRDSVQFLSALSFTRNPVQRIYR